MIWWFLPTIIVVALSALKSCVRPSVEPVKDVVLIALCCLVTTAMAWGYWVTLEQHFRAAVS